MAQNKSLFRHTVESLTELRQSQGFKYILFDNQGFPPNPEDLRFMRNEKELKHFQENASAAQNYSVYNINWTLLTDKP